VAADNGTANTGNTGSVANTTLVVHHPVADLDRLLAEIHRIQFTGSITLNFSQGSPSGTVEVKQKVQASFFEISGFLNG